jgi:hypothetical protein
MKKQNTRKSIIGLSVFFIGLNGIGYSPVAHAGGGDKIGGGGDSVICFADQNTNEPFRGTFLYAHYTLDYLTAINNGTVLEAYSTNQEALTGIINILSSKGFTLGQELRVFADSYESSSLMSKYRWIPQAPQAVSDEKMIEAKLPAFCEKVTSKLKGFHQAVYRKNNGNYVSLYYAPSIFEDQDYAGGYKIQGLKNKDIQLSWMIVHEFLRNYIDDAQAIRRVTELFFSSEFKNIPAATLADFFANIGLP